MIDYTVTVYKKAYGSRSPETFQIKDEGNQPAPAFVSLAGKNEIMIKPGKQHEGFYYAVFINGHLQVNSTIQEPMSAHNEQFDVQVPPEIVHLKNTPPKIQNSQESVTVSKDEVQVTSVGIPYDRQLDSFFVQEWGIDGDQEIPDWIQFLNKTIEEGIMFEFASIGENENESYQIYYVLSDGDKSAKYSFTLDVAGSHSTFDAESALLQRL